MWPSSRSSDTAERALGKWLITQRRMRAGKEDGGWSVRREEKLSLIHPRWHDKMAMKEEAWNRRCRELSDFYTKTSRWPRVEGAGPREKALGQWLSNQRQVKKGHAPGAWSLEREQSLRAIDTNWGTVAGSEPDARWRRKHDALKDSVEQMGRWPRQGADSQVEHTLAQWVNKQRLARKGNGAGRWTVDRETAMKRIAPDWATRGKISDTRR